MNQGASRKRRLVTERIRTLAQGWPAGTRLPTVRELCAKHGLASATMVRLLRQLEHEQVLTCRAGAGLYAGVATGRKTVGIVIGENIFAPDHSPYWTLLLHAAFRVAGERGLRCFSYMDVRETTMDWMKHAQLEHDIASGALDGIMVVVKPEASTLAWLRGGPLPVVELNGVGDVWRVCQDIAGTIEDAVELLADAGCKRVGLLAKIINPDSKPFTRALKLRGLRADPRLLWGYDQWATRIPHTSLEDFATGLVTARWETLGLVDARPDGIVIMDDTMARGAVRGFEARGVVVGRDVRIAALGTKHSPVLADQALRSDSGQAGKLILLLIDTEETVRMGYEMLEQLMAGKRPESRCLLVRPHVHVPEPP